MALKRFTGSATFGELYRDDNGDIWEAIAWILDPAVVLKNKRTGSLHVEVIGCLNAERYTPIEGKE